MISGGKSKYMNLLTLIKHESPKLYELISDLCLDGTFRSQRYKNTFLMPNAKLIKHIEELVDKDQDIKAIEIIRSLLLKGHFSPNDFKQGAVIGTVQFGSYVLANPEAVGKQVAESKKEIVVTRDNVEATIVLHYAGNEAPKTIEGKSESMVPISKKTGGAIDEDTETIRSITMKLIVANNPKKTLKNFFKAVAGVLNMLEETDKDRYNRAKFYLAANPILSWFFLVMPGYGKALVKASELKDFKWEAVTDYSTSILSAENVDYELNKSIMQKIRTHRSQLSNGDGDRVSLPKLITECYREMIPELQKVGAIDHHLAGNVDLKIRMDELRCMFDDHVETWEDMSDALAELGLIENYTEPKKRITICDSATYAKDLIKGVEAFMSGPIMFIKSPYFLYVPLTEEVETKLMAMLENKTGGSIVGGNPAQINTVVFSGGAARKALKKTQHKQNDVKLSALVKVLSKQQRESLKSML